MSNGTTFENDPIEELRRAVVISKCSADNDNYEISFTIRQGEALLRLLNLTARSIRLVSDDCHEPQRGMLIPLARRIESQGS